MSTAATGQSRMLETYAASIKSIHPHVVVEYRSRHALTPLTMTLTHEELLGSFMEYKGGRLVYAGSDRPVQVGDPVLLHTRLVRGDKNLRIEATLEPDIDQLIREEFLEATGDLVDIKAVPVPDDILTFAIGNVELLVPPTFIQVERVAGTEFLPTLRSKGSIKKASGRHDTRITLELIFPDEAAINDPHRGLRAIIAMFRRTPFVPVYNRYLNLAENIYAVCLHDLQVSTVPGFPRSLKATLVMLQFDWSPYLVDYSDFGSAIDWDLFNWYVQKELEEYGGQLPRLDLSREVELEFYAASTEVMRSVADNVREMELGNLRKAHKDARRNIATARPVLDRLTAALGKAHELIQLEKEGPGRRIPLFERDPFDEVEDGYIFWHSFDDLDPSYGQPPHQFSPMFLSSDETYAIGRSPFFHWRWVVWVKSENEELETLNSWSLFRAFAVEESLLPGGIDQLPSGPRARLHGLTLKRFGESDITDRLSKITGGGQVGLILNEHGQPEHNFQRFLDAIQPSIDYQAALADEMDQRLAEAKRPAELISESMELWDIPGMIHVVSAQAGVQNHFARMPVQSRSLSTYQYLGSHDHRLQLALHVDEEALSSLVDLFEFAQSTAIDFYSKVPAGFLRIESPLAKLFGIKHVLIEAMVSSSIPGFPGHYQVEMTLIDYDYMQASRTRGVFLTKSGDEFIIKAEDEQDVPGIVVQSSEVPHEWVRLLDVLPMFDCYPDLDLPTWEELADYLSQRSGAPVDIDDIRTNGGHFVDPDFYFLPPIMSEAEALESAMDERVILTEREGFQEEVLRRTVRAGKERMSRQFEPEPGQKPRRYPGEGEDSGPTPLVYEDEEGRQVQEEFFIGELDPLIEIGQAAGDLDAGELPDENELLADDLDEPKRTKVGPEMISSAFQDYVEHSVRGRMVRAFPTFYMFIIDEGRWVRTRRIWDNFYGFNAVSSIEVHHSRTMATGTAIIELANASMFIQGESEGRIRYRNRTWRLDMSRILPLTITKDILEERSSMPDNIILRPGARLHLRAGYGNNLQKLQTLFTGVITEVDYGDVVALVAQTDARELVDVLNFAPNQVSSGLFGGYYPREYLCRLLLFGDRGFLARQWEHLKNAAYREPIQARNFGHPSTTFGYMRRAGEVAQNIYRGNHTGKQRGIPVWDWVFKGEFKVPIDLYGKSIYDIGQILAASVPNFVFAVRPFEFRSTIFYGKPFWEYAYSYEVKRGPTLTAEEEAIIKRYQSFIDNMRKIQGVSIADEEIEGFLRQEVAPPGGGGMLSHGDLILQRRLMGWTDEEIDAELWRLPGYIPLTEEYRRRREEAVTGRELDVLKYPELRDEVIEMAKEGWRPNKGYWVREKRKAFSQWHIYTSMDDIIANNISLSTANVATDVIGTYKEDKGWLWRAQRQDDIMVSADPDIYPQHRRPIVVHTEISIQAGFIPILRRLGSWAYGSFARTVAMHIAAAALKDRIQQMYQGELIVMGDPTVWPYDTVYMADLHKEMLGTIFVREVYHSISLDTGFITVITPDVAAAVKDEEVYDWFGWAPLANMVSLLTGFRNSFAGTMRVLGLVADYTKAKVGPAWAWLQRTLFSRIAQFAAQRPALMTAGKFLARWGLRIGRIGALIASPATILWAPVLLLGFAMLNEGIHRLQFANRMIVANFLTYRGMEFSAGVDGYSTLTIGIMEEATKSTFWDSLKGVLPFYVQDSARSPEELFGPGIGRIFSDPVLVVGLTEPPDIQERLDSMTDLERAQYARFIKHESRMVKAAIRYLGVPYVRGGSDFSGLDISGFVYAVLNDWGRDIARQDSVDDYGRINLHRDPRPGDLILFDRNQDGRVDQVAVVLDPEDGLVISVLDNDVGELKKGVRLYNWRDLYRQTEYMGVFWIVGPSEEQE